MPSKTVHFFDNEALLHAMRNAADKGTTLHLAGLLSDGGVHSHLTHVFALIDMAQKEPCDIACRPCFLTAATHRLNQARATPIT